MILHNFAEKNKVAFLDDWVRDANNEENAFLKSIGAVQNVTEIEESRFEDNENLTAK